VPLHLSTAASLSAGENTNRNKRQELIVVVLVSANHTGET